jgi:septal ring factor EnvC (AmiA/AmiB activator)
MAEQKLKQIEKEVSDIKGKIEALAETMKHLEEDIHDKTFEVRPEYVQKLKRLEKRRFLTQEEFEKALRE